MPLRIIKTVWDYCSYNKKFLLFILVLLLIFGLLQDFFIENYGLNICFYIVDDILYTETMTKTVNLIKIKYFKLMYMRGVI